MFAAGTLRAQSYSMGPDSQPQDGVPKGAVTKHVLPAGVFYPGTPHNYAVYVPAQYDAKKPTAFMVFLDGSGYLGDDATRGRLMFDDGEADERHLRSVVQDNVAFKLSFGTTFALAAFMHF